MTGYGMNVTQRDGKPHFGSVIAKVQGQADPLVPPFVDLFPTMQHKPYNSPGPGLLGRAANPVQLDGDDLAAMKLQGMTLDHLGDRRASAGAARHPPRRDGRPHRHGRLLPAGVRRADLAANWSRPST